MIKLSKEKHDDIDILVIDVRPVDICNELNTEPRVYLGRITPPEREPGSWRWESRWGGNCGEVGSLEEAQAKIEMCSKGQYR